MSVGKMQQVGGRGKQEFFTEAQVQERVRNAISRSTITWWSWESILHHLYFIVLFYQRKLAPMEKVNWKVGLEKECAFYVNLFGGKADQCAQMNAITFAGLWHNVDNPDDNQKLTVGHLIMSFQNFEAVIHHAICIFGLALVYRVWAEKKVPAFVSWGLFLSLFFETWTMCVPYMVLFDWELRAFSYEPRNPLVEVVKAVGPELGDSDAFLDGFYLGGSVISFWWVSLVVLFLDGLATYRAWQFAVGEEKGSLFSGWTIMMLSVPAAIFAFFVQDFGLYTGERGWFSGMIIDTMGNSWNAMEA